jgi:putative nucleotidyltransferase with HDIG domain
MTTASQRPGQKAASTLAEPAAGVAQSSEPPARSPLPSLASSLQGPTAPIEPVIQEALPSLPPLSASALSVRPSIEPVESLPRDSLPPNEDFALERELVRQLRTGRAALPLLPQVAEAALRLANDPDARIDQLARLVDTDPPIAARFMSVANSVTFWRGLMAASTQSAIVRLGLANTRDLLFQVVYAASTTGLKKYQAAVLRSFKRSVVAAIAARTTAQELRHVGEYDYMSGLLHDIGEARVYRILDGLSLPVNDKELLKRLVQKYHCVAGAEVAMAWKLPTEIVDACAAHHDEAAAENPHVRLVMIADLIVEALEVATLGKPVNYAAFERLGVTPEVARVLIDKTEKGVGENRNSLRP